MIKSIIILAAGQVNKVKNNDPMTHTYQFHCNGGKGDTILITDTNGVKAGHGISEVHIFGKAFPGKFKS